MKHILFVSALILFVSCSKDESIKDYSAENDAQIQSYLKANNLTAEKTDSGLYYIIDTPGTGIHPEGSDRIKVTFKSSYTNGNTIDENTEGVSVKLNEVIPGWREGLTYFKEGGTGKLIIPAHLAYGSFDHAGIPAGSVVIFDIDLIYVNFKTENEEEILNYLTENEITAQKTESGLYYTIDEPGTGIQATETDIVEMTYKGYFTSGIPFDENSTGATINLQNVIEGFAEGVSLFKEGGSGTLYIPSHLAYGNDEYDGFAEGSVLLFDINLTKVIETEEE